ALPHAARRKGDPDVPYAPTMKSGLALLRPIDREPAATSHALVEITGLRLWEGRRERFSVIDFIPKPLDGDVVRRKVASIVPAVAPNGGAGVPAAMAPRGNSTIAFSPIHQALRSALIVDGDARFRKWFRNVMAINGLGMHEAESASEGLQVAMAERPWLIVSEMKLTGADSGLEFCRQIRAHVLTRFTPFLFLSDSDGFDERCAGLGAGADDFLTKRTETREILIRTQLVLKRYVELDMRTDQPAAVTGRIEVVGPIGVLQMCHLAELTGMLHVIDENEVAEVGFNAGQIVHARLAGASGASAVFRLLSWTRGRFEFAPGRVIDGAPIFASFDGLILDGCLRLDESRRRLADPITIAS
ncbi:MAG: DUF4388 domain-containing protein, partial [Vicinamibacteria bacterium]|nr:DUF4388 domain-containing protein [Vicinamibacteria bacterium]